MATGGMGTFEDLIERVVMLPFKRKLWACRCRAGVGKRVYRKRVLL